MQNSRWATHGAPRITYALLLCLQLNLALVGLLNVSLALEDPFDNQGLDGIYVDEALFEAEQVRLVLCCIQVETAAIRRKQQ